MNLKSILVTPKNQQEFEFISELLQKLTISSRILSESESADMTLFLRMKEVSHSMKDSAGKMIKKL